MAKITRTASKAYFQTDDVPTEAQYIDVFDSTLNFTDDVVTTIGAVGSDVLVPSEQATREALDLKANLVSPSFTTPTLGVASATSINKVALTAPATGSTITVADGKTLTASNTLTLTATDGSTLAVGTGGTLGTAAYTAATDYATSTQGTTADNAVPKSTYDAHSVLYATTDNTPVALTVGEQTVVGRATSGNIAAIAIDSDLSSVSASDDTIPSAKATKTALDLKAPIANPSFTGVVTTAGNIELGHASDTTISRVSAGVVAIEGVNIDTISSSSTLTNKTLTKPTIQGSTPAITAATDGATITFDLSASNIQTVTLGGNRTLALSNVSTGQVFMLELKQDATGSRTVTWFSTISWAGGSAPTLTTTANKTDVLGFRCTGTNTYIGYVIGQNI